MTNEFLEQITDRDEALRLMKRQCDRLRDENVHLKELNTQIEKKWRRVFQEFRIVANSKDLKLKELETRSEVLLSALRLIPEIRSQALAIHNKRGETILRITGQMSAALEMIKR